MDFPGSVIFGLLLSLYIFPGRRKVSHFMANIFFSPVNHDLYEFIKDRSEMIEDNLARR